MADDPIRDKPMEPGQMKPMDLQPWQARAHEWGYLEAIAEVIKFTENGADEKHIKLARIQFYVNLAMRKFGVTAKADLEYLLNGDGRDGNGTRPGRKSGHPGSTPARPPIS